MAEETLAKNLDITFDNTDKEAVSVSYTHLDVYKRQRFTMVDSC